MSKQDEIKKEDLRYAEALMREDEAKHRPSRLSEWPIVAFVQKEDGTAVPVYRELP